MRCSIRAVCVKVVVIFVGEDKPGKDGEAGNALALSMEPDEARRSCNQKMATRFMTDMRHWLKTNIKPNPFIFTVPWTIIRTPSI